MLRRRLYYTVKPYVPWRMRIALRGLWARLGRRIYRSTWPIDQSAKRPPEGWPGWPEGKSFAFTLTHDVEGPDGLEKCRRLAELEMELGFRSSFNFIPEGPYTVPPSLRAWLTDHGFEVGVHDLHHDGKLYRNRREFAAKAARINHYLQDWSAVGFRSGFMLHNLEWQHDINTQYDTSTFDTDPFEPQSEGAGTIFPFWVPAPAGAQVGRVVPNAPSDLFRRIRDNPPYPLPEGLAANLPLTPSPDRAGYVELPYTLPQDSTLFLILREATPEIWLRKLDWLAANGGMALVNVHPDYMRFDGEPLSKRTYPFTHYRQLLEHARRQHASAFWHPLPRALAEFARQIQPRPVVRRSRRVCMITYSSYEFDNRVRRYAESLAARGDEVDVLAVAWENKGARTTFLDGVKVTRLSRKMTFGKGLFTYFAHVCRFPLAAFGVVSARVLAKPYDFVHVHNMPDFLVFCALFARLRGAKVILDLHDLVPELYADKKPGWRQSFAGHLLRWEERISARFVQHLIISNHLWLKTVTGRSAAAEKCSVFVNNVDTRIFYPRKRTRSDDRRIILFHGSLSYHQGVDLVIQAMPTVLARVPKAEFHVYGGPSERCEELGRLAREVGAEQAVRFSPSVLLHEIPQIIADADVGVVAKRADSFGNLAYSTKILEFMSQGIPVVLARTEIDQYYFDDTVARFFPSGDVPALADALVEVLLDSELKNRLTRNATDYVRRNSWETRKQAYFAIVDALCDKKTVVPSV